MSIKEFLV